MYVFNYYLSFANLGNMEKEKQQKMSIELWNLTFNFSLKEP